MLTWFHDFILSKFWEGQAGKEEIKSNQKLQQE
jgi:hypothetical protein